MWRSSKTSIVQQLLAWQWLTLCSSDFKSPQIYIENRDSDYRQTLMITPTLSLSQSGCSLFFFEAVILFYFLHCPILCYEYFACMYECAPPGCLVPTDVTRGSQISWNWSYWCLWAAMTRGCWELSLGPLKVQVPALNCWVISSAPSSLFLKASDVATGSSCLFTRSPALVFKSGCEKNIEF